MSVEMSHPSTLPPQPAVVNGELRCALTGVPVSPDDAYWAPPLITARELVTTMFNTLFRTPSNLGQVLFAEQENVPYAPDAREQLGSRRTAEQLKLLVGLLVIAALIFVPIYVMTTG